MSLLYISKQQLKKCYMWLPSDTYDVAKYIVGLPNQSFIVYAVNNVANYIEYGPYFVEAYIPEYANYSILTHAIRTSHIIIESVTHIYHHPMLHSQHFSCLRPNIDILFVNQTPEICMNAVTHDGMLLQFIANQTPDLCMAAIRNNICAFAFVKEQTHDICLEAVQIDGYAIGQVKHQTMDICMMALDEDAGAIRRIRNQTTELCMKAVKICGSTLRYVRHKTIDICLEAVKRDRHAIAFVPQDMVSLCMESIKDIQSD